MNTKQTPLHAFHYAHNARMVPFAGWDMPVQYAAGIKAEHLATRQSAGLFDVSHMAQLEISGPQAKADLSALTPRDIAGIGEGRLRYSLFLDDQGGVLDDLMIGRIGDVFYLVGNAGRANHDIAHLQKYLDASTKMVIRTDQALLALQGPQSANVLGMLSLRLDDFQFMQLRRFDFDGVELLISRSGYTGEDGFAPSLDRPAALGFVEVELATPGTSLLADTPGSPTAVTVSELPIVQHQYFN